MAWALMFRSLAHSTCERSGENLMEVDMEGSGYSLFDPEIASKKLVDGEEVLFSLAIYHLR